MDSSQPMTLEDIERLLIEASRLSNHRHFVIAGSLSAIGAVVHPPLLMVLSRDVDLYPKLDPERGFIEIANELSRGGPFDKANGFYADPITPKVLSMPQGWESRLMQIPLAKGVVAWFTDPNDTAVGKLMRGQDNDQRWIQAGLAERILSAETIIQRMATVENSLNGDAARGLKLLAEIVSHIAGDGGQPDVHPVPKG